MRWLLLALLLTSSAYAQPIGGGGGCNSPYGATGVGCAPGSGSVTQASSAPAIPQTGCILVNTGVCMLANTGVKILVQ